MPHTDFKKPSNEDLLEYKHELESIKEPLQSLLDRLTLLTDKIENKVFLKQTREITTNEEPTTNETNENIRKWNENIQLEFEELNRTVNIVTTHTTTRSEDVVTGLRKDPLFEDRSSHYFILDQRAPDPPHPSISRTIADPTAIFFKGTGSEGFYVVYGRNFKYLDEQVTYEKMSSERKLKQDFQKCMRRHKKRINRDRKAVFLSTWSHYDALANSAQRAFDNSGALSNIYSWGEVGAKRWQSTMDPSESYLLPKFYGILNIKRRHKIIRDLSDVRQLQTPSCSVYGCFGGQTGNYNCFKSSTSSYAEGSTFDKLSIITKKFQDEEFMEQAYQDAYERPVGDATKEGDDIGTPMDEFEIQEIEPLHRNMYSILIKLVVLSFILDAPSKVYMAIIFMLGLYSIGLLNIPLRLLETIRDRQVGRPTVHQQLHSLSSRDRDETSPADFHVVVTPPPPYWLRFMYQIVFSFFLSIQPWWAPNPYYVQ